VAYTDLTLNYDFGVKHSDWNVFLTINNLFDRSPPAAPQPYFVFGRLWSSGELLCHAPPCRCRTRGGRLRSGLPGGRSRAVSACHRDP